VLVAGSVVAVKAELDMVPTPAAMAMLVVATEEAHLAPKLESVVPDQEVAFHPQAEPMADPTLVATAPKVTTP
jgi:hypothetical protein